MKKITILTARMLFVALALFLARAPATLADEAAANTAQADTTVTTAHTTSDISPTPSDPSTTIQTLYTPPTAPAQDPTITVEATKVICDSEDLLPNWGNGGPDITATTATDFVAASNGHCHLTPNWGFEWSDQSTRSEDTPGTFIGEAPGYTPFGPTNANGSTTVTIPFPSSTTEFHFREVLQTGYIPFTFETNKNNSDPVSAEFYCADDVENYDNFDVIRTPVAGTSYHCVAFNVSTTPVVTTPPTTPPITPITPPADTTPSEPAVTSGDSGRHSYLLTPVTSSAVPPGRVLGETTMCSEYITDYIKLGQKNDPANVLRLQTFLNDYMKTVLTPDGIYGPKTFAALKAFQVKEKDQVLVPWKTIGYNNNLVGTGYVYKTTKRWINLIKCPTLDLPLPTLP